MSGARNLPRVWGWHHELNTWGWIAAASPARREDAAARYAAGESLSLIAAIHGTSTTTVRGDLRRMGIALPPRPSKKPRNTAIYAAKKAGETYRAIAARHGISVERVRQIVAKEATLERRREDRIRRAVCFVPADRLPHNWTPEDQHAEFLRERAQ